MFTETEHFVDEDGRTLAASTWTLPNGEVVLVCQGKVGFSLYTPPEWNNATVASYQADPEGHVLLHGQRVARDDPAWVVPQEVRDRAVR
jgi:hypothetical protein